MKFVSAIVLAVAASAFVMLSACSHRIASDNFKGSGRMPSWIIKISNECALGYAGPTLYPADQIVYAQQDAREKLAFEKLGVKVESVIVEIGGQIYEVTTQEAQGIVQNVRIVSMWYDNNGTGPLNKRDTLYALACLSSASESVKQPSDIPEWVYNIPQSKDKICALGLAGPTIDPEDGKPNAEADARERLAEAISVRAHVFSLDVNRENFSLAGKSESEEWARELANSKGQIEATWFDEDGSGPLGRKNVTYALACLNL